MIEAIKSLPAFDVFVILFLLYCLFMGGKRGMFLQITSIFALLAGWYVSSRYSANFESWFPVGGVLRQKATPVLTFFAVMILVTILGRVFSGMFIGGVLKEINRQLGALFGLVKGVIVCLVITYFAVTLSNPTKNFVIGSQSGKLMVQILYEAQKIIPDNPQTARVKSALDDFKKAAGGDNAVKTTSSSYQISKFKDDITKSFQKTREKGVSFKRSVEQFNSLTDNLNNLKMNLPFGGGTQEATGEIGTHSPAQTTAAEKHSVTPDIAAAANEIPRSVDLSQDDIYQKADAIFSRNVFRSVSPVDESDRQSRSAASNDIYSSSAGSSSGRFYTPSY